MLKYKHHVIWVTIIALLSIAFVPATPAYAASLDSLLGRTAGPDSSGKSIVDILLGLLAATLFGKIFNTSSDPAGNQYLPGKSTQSGGKEVMGFYAEWWGTDTSSYTSMMKNVDTIKTIIPFWATLQADGSVSDRGGNDHASVVKFARQNNIKTLLMVNNAKQNSDAPPIHTVLANPVLRATAISNLEAYIKNYNLDGINIDFEMVPASDKSNLTAFMRELSARLKPQGYIISIDVFPKTDESNDVSVAYDYAELAKYTDRIVIMAYDNHGVWSDPGPIADIRWVENNLKYALKFIPKQKLYLGVAGYGYDWSSKGVESLEYGPITNLINRFGVDPKWDEAAKSPYFNYTGPDGISHTLWYENSKSLKYKLDLAKKYDIAGVALWKLGQEDPASWQVFKDGIK